MCAAHEVMDDVVHGTFPLSEVMVALLTLRLAPANPLSHYCEDAPQIMLLIFADPIVEPHIITVPGEHLALLFDDA